MSADSNLEALEALEALGGIRRTTPFSQKKCRFVSYETSEIFQQRAPFSSSWCAVESVDWSQMSTYVRAWSTFMVTKLKLMSMESSLLDESS